MTWGRDGSCRDPRPSEPTADPEKNPHGQCGQEVRAAFSAPPIFRERTNIPARCGVLASTP